MAVQLVFYFFEKKVAAEVMDFRGVSKITFPFISVFLIFKSAKVWGGTCPSYATNYGTLCGLKSRITETFETENQQNRTFFNIIRDDGSWEEFEHKRPRKSTNQKQTISL